MIFLKMSVKQVKNIIQNSACEAFPAQELWFRENDLNFWAYDKQDSKVITTQGIYKNNKLSFTTLEHDTDNVEEFVEKLIDIKNNEGYECFASQL